MSGGWSEDPELAQLRDRVADEARKKQLEQDEIKRDQDAFMDQYRALISGGFNQAADILRASGKYGEPTVYTPSTWRLSQWEIQGRGWGERTVLLSFRLSGGSLSFGDDYMPMSSFSEQWFRKKLLEKVSDLVS